MPWRGGLVVALGLMVSGCFLSAIQVASWTATGVSYVFSGKGLGDHAISLAMNQDCATWRVLNGEEVCVDYGGDFENSWDAMASTWEVPEPGIVDDSVLLAGNPEDPVTDAPDTPATPQLARNAETSDEGAAPTLNAERLEAKPADDTVLEGLPVPAWAVARRNDTPWVRSSFAPRLTDREELVVHDDSASYDHAPTHPKAGSAEPAVYLVIGSFRNESNAKRLANRHAGIQTAVSKVSNDKGALYRLLAGPLEAASLADGRRQLGKAGFRNVWAVRLCHRSLLPPPCQAVVQEAYLR